MVTVQARRKFGGIGVIVETAAHFQQLGDGDVVAVGHARDVLGHRIVETELPLLSQLHDHRGRHRLGIRGDPEVGVGAGRVRGVQLRGAAGGGEITLRCAQENHSAGDEEFLDSLVHQGLERSLVDRLERRRAAVHPPRVFCLLLWGQHRIRFLLASCRCKDKDQYNQPY